MLALRLTRGAHPAVQLRRLLVAAASAGTGFLLLCTLGHALGHPGDPAGSLLRLAWCMVPLAATVHLATAVARADPGTRPRRGLSAIGLGPARLMAVSATTTALSTVLGSMLALLVFLHLRGDLTGMPFDGAAADFLAAGQDLPLPAALTLLSLLPLTACLAVALTLRPREVHPAARPAPRSFGRFGARPRTGPRETFGAYGRFGRRSGSDMREGSGTRGGSRTGGGCETGGGSGGSQAPTEPTRPSPPTPTTDTARARTGDVASGGARAEGAFASGAVSGGVHAEGASTAGAVSAGVVSAGVVSAGVVSAGVVSGGDSPAGAVSHGAASRDVPLAGVPSGGASPEAPSGGLRSAALPSSEGGVMSAPAEASRQAPADGPGGHRDPQNSSHPASPDGFPPAPPRPNPTALPWGAAVLAAGLAVEAYASRSGRTTLTLPDGLPTGPASVLVGWTLTALGLALAGPGLTHLCGRLLQAVRPGALRLLAGRCLMAESTRIGRPLGVLCAALSGAYALVSLHDPAAPDRSFGPLTALGALVVTGCALATLLTAAVEARQCRADTTAALLRLGAPATALRGAAALRAGALLVLFAPLTLTVAELAALPLTG